MTVSRVLNRERGVGPIKRARVELAMRELNYVPNPAAQALATARLTDKIAFLFDTQDMAALGEMVSIGSDEAVRLNVKLVFVRVRRRSDPVLTLETLQSLGIQGVLLSAPLCDDIPLRTALRDANMRFVAVGSSDAVPYVSSIGIDDRRAAYELTRHLLRQGHRRIGFIAGDPRHDSSARRRAGHELALIEYGITPDKRLQWEARYTVDSSIAAADALARDPPVTAIFASNDDLAAVVNLARGRGIAVPRSLTVCGFGDSEESSTAGARLTMVRRPVTEMVAWSIRQMADELAALDRGEEPVIRSTLVDYEITYQKPDAEPEGT